MKKRITELSPQEQEKVRKYNRELKRAERAAKKAAQTPDADDWSWDWDERYPKEFAGLRAYRDEFAAKVSEELGRQLYEEQETLYWVSTASYCFKKDSSPWVRKVTNPNGILVGGGLYPDVIGDQLVENTHRFELEKSPTYSALYRELLNTLDKTFGQNSHGSEGDSARDIKAELAGTYQYVLPAPEQSEPEPKKLEAKPKPEPSAPTVADILLLEQENFLRQLRSDGLTRDLWVRAQDPNIAPEARRYLDGV